MVTQSGQDHLYLFNKPKVIFIKYTEYMLNTLIEHTKNSDTICFEFCTCCITRNE